MSSDHPNDGLERRADIRVRLDVPVATFRHGTPHRFRLVDLSCGGAQLERIGLELPPQVHTMMLDLGVGAPLRLLARTVWSTGDRYAVVFLALDDFDRLTIAERIDQVLSKREEQGLVKEMIEETAEED